jgi:hypothetical protein
MVFASVQPDGAHEVYQFSTNGEGLSTLSLFLGFSGAYLSGLPAIRKISDNLAHSKGESPTPVDGLRTTTCIIVVRL